MPRSVGDRVVFDADEHLVVGLSGMSVRLRASSVKLWRRGGWQLVAHSRELAPRVIDGDGLAPPRDWVARIPIHRNDKTIR